MHTKHLNVSSIVSRRHTFKQGTIIRTDAIAVSSLIKHINEACAMVYVVCCKSKQLDLQNSSLIKLYLLWREENFDI